MDFSFDKYNISEVFSSYNELPPSAFAHLTGGPLAPHLNGKIYLYQLSDGVYIRAYITGIPTTTTTGDPVHFHGFHIHENGNCVVGDPANPFQAAGGHWNPTNQPHPFHAGDLPSILSTNGIAMMSVYVDEYAVKDVLGKSFILHEKPDDFITQPAGNSGLRLACGVIQPCSMHTAYNNFLQPCCPNN